MHYDPARVADERMSPGVSVIDLIESAAARFPGHLALQMDEDRGLRRYTYVEMMDRVRRLSRSLGGSGIETGNRVILWARLTPSWVLAYLGALHRGCVVVPLDADYSPEEVAVVLGQTGAAALFATWEGLARLREAGKIAPSSVLLVGLDREQDGEGVTALESLLQGPPAGAAAVVSPDDVATIFYTSGTTGAPKGVVLLHRSLALSVSGLLQYLEGSEADRVLALIPSHHILGAVANVLTPLAKGVSITYLRALNSVELLRALKDAGITILPAVPQLFYLLHQRIFDEVRRKRLPVRLLFRALLEVCGAVRQATGLNAGRRLFASVHRALGGRLRLLVSAGSSFDPGVIRDFFALGFTVQQGYALTESGGGGTFTPFFANRLGSVGRPMPGVEMKLVGTDESGVGEIAIAGPTIMRGYYRDEAATAEVLRDGWFHTGDLGRVDDGGNYYITGRRKDMIVLSSGKKIHPEEIELHYSRSPVIKEVCVLGLGDASDYASSERLHAVIVPDFEHLRTNRIVNCRDAIREDVEELSAALPAHKRVLSFEIRTDPLPRTTTRKLMRYALAAEIAKRGGDGKRPAASRYRFVDGDDRLLALETSQRIIELIRRECRVEDGLHLDMNLELDLSVDSLSRIELIAQVESALNVALDEADAVLTVRDLLRRVEEKRGASAPAVAGPAAEHRITWKEILSSTGDAAATGYLLRSSGVTVLAHHGLLRVVYLLARVFFRLEVRGLENLPRQRPFIICPNHQSYLDGVLMAAVLPYGVFKHLLTLGLTTFFSGGIKGFVARLGRVVPIDPDTNVVRATQISAVGLRAGQNLLIFPEGSMTSDGRLQPFKKGAAILARELEVPIVPVAIRGSFHAWSKVRPGIHAAPITITFGRPFGAAATSAEGDRESEYAEITRRLKEAVEELMGEPRRARADVGALSSDGDLGGL
jgi:long-chain acyl-CoA synthetase